MRLPLSQPTSTLPRRRQTRTTTSSPRAIGSALRPGRRRNPLPRHRPAWSLRHQYPARRSPIDSAVDLARKQHEHVTGIPFTSHPASPAPRALPLHRSLSTILPAAFGSILFLGIMGGLLLLLLRRRRARRNEAVSPFQSFSDRRISTTPSLRSDPSTSSFVPEATFIQPVHRSVGVPAAGSIGSGTVTSDEKRLQQAKRVGVVRSGDGPSTPRRVLGRDDGEADYRDEVFRRKMDGWSALARARGSTRADERDDKDPFSDQYGTPSGVSAMRHSSYSTRLALTRPDLRLAGPLLPSPPSPLRLSLTVATSLPSPRASLHPSASSRPYLAAPLSPHFRSNYSPTTAADELEEQAEDGGVSLMGGAGLRPVGQAPPAYQW